MAEADDSRAVLIDGPAAVFVWVAGADGTIDERERARFDEILLSSAAPGSAELGALIEAARERAAQVLSAPDTAAAEKLLSQVSTAAQHALAPEDAEAYRRGLIFIAERVASASGGGRLGLGSRTSEQERAAIERLHELLA
ncbi:MAG: TerB family tellurite resistance protein [Myxococcales bacterium]|nr:TerB family tellurite resistance protein [Myxococcales bacterium]